MSLWHRFRRGHWPDWEPCRYNFLTWDWCCRRCVSPELRPATSVTAPRSAAKATAAAEQRLRERIEALIEEAGGLCVASGDRLGLLDGQEDPICVTHSELLFDGFCEDDPRELRAVLALLDTPPPASPRQGEPVDVERLDRALGSLEEDDLDYDYPVAMSGEPLDPVLFVRYDALRAALSEPAGEPG